MKKNLLCLLLVQIVWAEPLPYQVRARTPEPSSLDFLPVQKREILSLPRAIELALESSPSRLLADSQVAAATARLKRARSELLPKLGISSNYSRQLHFQGSGLGFPGADTQNLSTLYVPTGWTHSVALQQLLFDFGASSARAQAESEKTRASQAERQEALEDLRLEVVREYFVLLADLALEKVRKSEVANRGKHLEVAQARWKTGLGIASDVTRATSLLSNAMVEETRARAQVALSQVRLGALIGWEPGRAVQPEEETGTAPDSMDLKSSRELALSRRPEIEMRSRNLEAARAQLRAAEAAFAPSLSSGLTYQNRQNPSFGSLVLSFEVRFNPYDGGNQQGLEQEAAAEVRRMEAELELASRKVLREVTESQVRLAEARERSRLAAANLSAAQETLQLSEARYRKGLGVFLEVSEAQASLVAAQSESEVARWETWIQYFSSQRAMGIGLSPGLQGPESVRRLD